MKEYKDLEKVEFDERGEEDVLNILVEAEDNHNPQACMKIAEWYKTGTFLGQSDEEYVRMLHKACDYADPDGNIIRIMKDRYDDEHYEGGTLGVIANVSADEWRASSILGDAAYQLGLYYSNFNTIEELRNAEYYFKVSMWCFFDTEKLLESISSRIHNLEYIAKNPSLSPSISSFKQSIFRNISLEAIENYCFNTYTSVNSKIRKEFKEENWSKLQNETQVYLVTALMTFSFYICVGQDNYKNVDFASCVSLLMRGLEYELKLRFYKGYMLYLQQHYADPYRYIQQNKLDIEDATKARALILYKNRRGNLYYKDYDKCNHSYTLGSVTASIGFANTNSGDYIQADATFLEYCKNSLIEMNWDKTTTKKWIRDLCDNIEELRIMRNLASHGGKVLTETDAEYVLNQMIFTQKILERLVSVCCY